MPDTTKSSLPDYGFKSAGATYDVEPILSRVFAALDQRAKAGDRVLEIGCGNGYAARRLGSMGFDVTAVDPSESGIRLASDQPSSVRFAVGSVEDGLADEFGLFDAVISIEVIEHCYSVSRFCESIAECLAPGGVAIVTTPYHGFAKNLAIVLAGRFDQHFNPLWEGGHIKFFSRKTIARAFENTGLRVKSITTVGRVPWLGKSMILVATNR